MGFAYIVWGKIGKLLYCCERLVSMDIQKFNSLFLLLSRPGMLAAIADKICEEGMLVENMTTEVVMQRNGRRDFVVTAECTTAMPWDKDHIRELTKEFSNLKQSLALDIVDVRVHSL